MRELAHRLVFLDETSVRTGLTRLRGRCPKGERLYGSTPFGRWHSQTFVAGLTCDELIAPWIIPGAMDGDAFDTYVETQLVPALVPGEEDLWRKLAATEFAGRVELGDDLLRVEVLPTS